MTRERILFYQTTEKDHVFSFFVQFSRRILTNGPILTNEFSIDLL